MTVNFMTKTSAENAKTEGFQRDSFLFKRVAAFSFCRGHRSSRREQDLSFLSFSRLFSRLFAARRLDDRRARASNYTHLRR